MTTMACHGVGPGCTVIGADDACGDMWTAWAGAAVLGSTSVGVMAASPWTVRRRWWRSVGSVHVVVGSVIEWRRMAWSPGVISSHRSVLLWTAHSRGRFRKPLRSRVVRCCRRSCILVMGWVRGSLWGLSCAVGGDGAWGISSSGCCGAFASCTSALMVAKTSWRVLRAVGVRCRIVPSDMVPRWVPRVLLYGDGGGGVVFRRPSVRIVVEGVEGDGVAVFQAVECKEGVEAVPGVPGWAGVGRGCRFQEGVHGAYPGVFPEKVVIRSPLVVAPFLLPAPLEGRVVRWELSVDGLVVLLGSMGWARVFDESTLHAEPLALLGFQQRVWLKRGTP